MGVSPGRNLQRRAQGRRDHHGGRNGRYRTSPPRDSPTQAATARHRNCQHRRCAPPHRGIINLISAVRRHDKRPSRPIVRKLKNATISRVKAAKRWSRRASFFSCGSCTRGRRAICSAMNRPARRRPPVKPPEHHVIATTVAHFCASAVTRAARFQTLAPSGVRCGLRVSHSHP